MITEPTIKLLVVDDQPGNLLAMEAMLEPLGAAVVKATSGIEALRCLLDDEFAAILLDVQMPELDGYETATLIRQRDKTRGTPIIFLTASECNEPGAFRAYTVGAVDYLYKPVVPEVLQSKILVFMDLFRKAAALDRQNAELTRRRSEAEAAAREREASLRALRVSEARLRAVLDHSQAVIYIKDLEGRYTLVNRAFESLFHVEPGDVAGRTDVELFPGALATAYRANDRIVLDGGEPLQFEETALHADGEHTYLSCKVPLRDAEGTAYAVCGISTDITERKRSEEIVRLAQSEAERANQAKGEFLSRMSHDLRTPLNAIIGFAQLLDVDDLNPEQRDSVTHILKGGQHLLGLINEVLDIAHIESGRLSLATEPIALDDMVNEVMSLVRPLAAAQHIDLCERPRLGPGTTVSGDRRRVSQVLLNLVSNAIKYNRHGGAVTITCDSAAAGHIRVAVRDTGPGIAAAKLPLLFRPFERLGAEQTEIEGTGLGLAVCKRLAEAMGGSVGVESSVGLGSTFWVDLPRADGQGADGQMPSVTHARVETCADVSGTVLYVEDNGANRRLLERLLKVRRPAVTLITASDGAGGLRSALARRPQLILADLALPDMNGEELLRRLGEDSRTCGIPVAVLSGDATPERMKRLLASGATAYLTKPLEMTRLLGLIDGVLASTAER